MFGYGFYILFNTLNTHGTSWSWRNIYYSGTRKTITTMRRAIACGDARGRDIPAGAAYIYAMVLGHRFLGNFRLAVYIYHMLVVIILKSCLVFFFWSTLYCIRHPRYCCSMIIKYNVPFKINRHTL